MDNSGAAVPGVRVTLTSTATEISTSATTNSNGDYQFPDVRVVVYNVTEMKPICRDGARHVLRTGG